MAVPNPKAFFRGHCGLCRLAYVPGDLVYYADGSREYVVEVTESTEMAFYHGARYAFHVSCCRLATAQQAEDVASLFECSERVHRLREKRRVAWARQRLTAKHSHGSGSDSGSGAIIILRDHIRKYLTINAINLLRAPPVPDSIVSLSQQIYYTTANVEGRSYVVSLTNHPTPETKPLAVLVPEINPRSVVYVEYDSFGVLSVVIGSSSVRPLVPGRRDRSWTSFAVSNFAQIVGRTNRAVINKIFCTSHSMMYCLYPGDLSWAFPMPPNPALYTQLLRGHVIAPRFHFIPLNTPDIFGYSACWHGGLVSLFAHTSLDDMPDYDRPHDTWFFLPVDAPRERIASIWRRESATPNNGSVAIETSSGRLMVWGPYPQDGDQGSPIDSGTWSNHSGRWELIHLAGHRPSRIHYEDSDFIRALAFEGPMPSSAGRRLVIPPRNVPMHPDLLPESFFYNEAELRGVRTIIPCKVGKAYTGMVLLYRGGRKGSVGAVRLDRLRRPIELNNRSDIWFGTSYNSGMYPYISAIAAREPRSRSPRMRVNGTARLGWWWSRSQSQITFKNRKNSELCPLLDSGRCATYPSTSATPHSSEFPLTDCYSDKPIAPEHLKLLAMTMHISQTSGGSSKDGASREDTDSKSQGSSRLEGHDEEGGNGEGNKGKGIDTSCADAMTESEIDRRVSLRVHAVLMARYSTRSRTSTAPGNVMRPTGNYMWTARERMRQEEEEMERQREREREREREMALAANPNRSGAGNDSRPGEGSGTRRTRDEDSDAEDQRLMREALESHGNRDFYDQIYRVRLPSAESPNGSARDDPAIGAGNDEEDEIDDSPATQPMRPAPISSSLYGRTTTMRVSREGAFEVDGASRAGPAYSPLTVETRNGTATAMAMARTTSMRDAPAAQSGIASRAGTAYDPIERPRKHSRTGEGDDTPTVARVAPAVREAYDPIERPRKRSRNEGSNGTAPPAGDMMTQVPGARRTSTEAAGEAVAVSRGPLSRTPIVESFSDGISAARSSTRLPAWHRSPMATGGRNSAPAADGSSWAATAESSWAASMGGAVRFTDQGRTVPREGTTRPAQRGNRSRSPYVRFGNQGNGNWDHGNKRFDGMQ